MNRMKSEPPNRSNIYGKFYGANRPGIEGVRKHEKELAG